MPYKIRTNSIIWIKPDIDAVLEIIKEQMTQQGKNFSVEIEWYTDTALPTQTVSGDLSDFDISSWEKAWDDYVFIGE